MNKKKITNKKQIAKDTPIGEIISKHPETIKVFLKHRLHCIGCQMANLETLEIGAKAHKINLKKILKELNDVIKKKK